MTNTGNVTLSGIVVTDDQPGVTVAVRAATWRPGRTRPAPPPARPSGARTRTSARSPPPTPSAQDVTDADPSHYFGAQPAIHLLKFTNDPDADTGPGPLCRSATRSPGPTTSPTPATSPLNDVVVTDDHGAPGNCPPTTVGPAPSSPAPPRGHRRARPVRERRQSSPARAQSRSTGTPTPPTTSVSTRRSTSSSPRTARTPTPPRVPFVTVGDRVTWTYVVTNTGNVPLTWAVNDDQISALACRRIGLIGPGQSLTCRASRLAQPGQYENIGSVTGDEHFGNPGDRRGPVALLRRPGRD